MQPWQIKALELEASVLKHLDGFIHEHALYFFIGAIYLLLALLAWIFSGGLRRKFPNQPNVRAGIGIIIQPHRPPPASPPVIGYEYEHDQPFDNDDEY
ncbi:MAG: hypothetical protein ABSC24_14165 [Verrucomicrobiota bacterium]|jgi:hypothetical protein